MTVFRSDAVAPSWCELEQFEIVNLAAGETRSFPRRAPRQRVLVTSGYCQAAIGHHSQVVREGQFVDARDPQTGWEFRSARVSSQVVLLYGRWGDELGGSGLFSVQAGGTSQVKGDPVEYPKDTGLDSHYHDCDEYWLILEGTGTVVVGARHLKVTPGDCIAIGMGHHHDLPNVGAPVKAVYFETTLEGLKRVGHLWNHTHGLAQPMMDRV